MVTARLAGWLEARKISQFHCEPLKLIEDPAILSVMKNCRFSSTLDRLYPRERALRLAPDLVGPYIPGPSREPGAWPPSTSASLSESSDEPN